MAALWLDYQQERPFHWAGPLLLALALLALTLTAAYYLELSAQADSWEEKVDRIERGHGLKDRAVAGEQLVQEVSRANEVLRQLTLPWEELFRAVESAAGRKVALLALEPDMEKRQVKIGGEARDMAALLNYITQLEAQEAFGAVYLQSHQVQQRDPDKPVRFALLAVWRGKP